MARGKAINRSHWPEAGPHRALLEHLDAVHRANGMKSMPEIAQEMGLTARSRVNVLLRGTNGRLPADEPQLQSLVQALGGDDDDVATALQHYRAETRARQGRAPETKPWRLDTAFQRHWEPRSRGVERAAHPGWYFTGRTQALRELAAWLGTSPGSLGAHRAMVVTGDPGSGKSAVLARLIVPTDAGYRARIPAEVLDAAAEGTVAEVGAIDAAVHAAGKTTAQIVEQIAASFGSPGVSDGQDLLDLLLERATPTIVALDALDESAQPREVLRDLVVPLIREAPRSGTRVIVGTRRELLSFLRPGARVIDLDLDRYFSADDVAHYITAHLLADKEPSTATPYRGLPELAETIGHEAAAKAGNCFLIAQLVALDLVEREDVIDPFALEAFPSSVSDAMERYLASAGAAIHRRGILNEPAEACAGWVRDLLRPLACAKAQALTDDGLWAELATRLGTRVYTPQDVRRLRDHTPAFALLRQMEIDGQTGWSLFHEALAEYVRDDAARHLGREESVHAAFVDVLLERTGKDGRGRYSWAEADWYTRSGLAQHAAAVGRLDELVVDPDFLLIADRERLLPLLPALTDPDALAAAHVYEVASHTMGGVTERVTTLALTARLYGINAMATALVTGHRATWDIPWARWTPPGRHRRLPDHPSAVNCVATGMLGDLPVAVTGTQNGAVQLWDLPAGSPVGASLAAHEGRVNAVAVTAVDDTLVAVTGGADGSVRLWEPAVGAPVGEPLTGHDGSVLAVDVTRVGDRVLAVSGGADGSVRLWDVGADGAAGESVFVGHSGAVHAVVFADAAGRAVAISGGADRTVRLWDVADGTAVGEPWEGHQGTVNAMAVAALPDGPMLVTGATDGTLRLWPIAGGGTPAPEVLTGHQGWVNAVATGDLQGVPVAVSVSNDRTVRTWDLRARRQHGRPKTGHRQRITGVALTAPHGRPVAVTSGSDRTVRLWEMTAREPESTSEPNGHTGGINAIANARVNGRRVALTASNDRTVQVWDVATGDLFGLTLQDDSGLRCVAATEDDSNAVAVTGGSDGTIQLWDLATAEARGPKMAGHKGKVNGVGFAEIGGRTAIISVGDDRTLRCWTLSGAPLGEPITGHRGAVNAVAAVTVEGIPLAVTAGNDRTVRVWNLATGLAHREPLAGHADWVRALALLQVNGRPLIASAGNDRSIRIWDLLTGELRVPPLRGHSGGISSLATGTLDGRPFLVSGAGDGTLRVWDDLWGPAPRPLVLDLGSPIQSVNILADQRILIAGPPGLACIRSLTNSVPGGRVG